jgi:hypothetical protein
MEQTVSFRIGGYRSVNILLDKCRSSSFEKLVFSDLQEMLLEGKTLDEHYKTVFTTPGTSYRGLDKFTYEDIIKALQIIIDTKIKRLRCNKQKEAIAFLHQVVKLSPNMIQNILNLFDLKSNIPYILESSNKLFSGRPQPQWVQNIKGD